MASAGPDCETPSPTQDWKKVCARCILPEVIISSLDHHSYNTASASQVISKCAENDLYRSSGLERVVKLAVIFIVS